MLQLSPKKTLRQQVSLEKRCTKLVSVLGTFASVTETKKEALATTEIAETIEIAETTKDGKESESGEYLENLA